MIAVRFRLMALKNIIYAGSDPMESEIMRCRHCDPSLSFHDLQFPTGHGGFVCPRCNTNLELLPLPGSSHTAATTTLVEDLAYFFELLKEAEEACEAASHDEIASWSHGTETHSVN